MQESRANSPAGTFTDGVTLPGASAQASARPLSHGSSRRFLAICLAPIVLIGAACAASATMHRRQPEPTTSFQTLGLHDGQAGVMDESARHTASVFLGRLTGRPVEVRKTALVSAYSLQHRPGTVPQWSVLCQTDFGSYLLRINSRTGGVYAVNRIETSAEYAAAAGEYTGDPASCGGGVAPDADEANSSDTAIEATADCDVSGLRMTRRAAQAKALFYLRKIGVETANVKAVPLNDNPTATFDSSFVGHTYNFSFRGVHRPTLIDVGVSSRDGQIETLWSATRPI